MADRVVAETVLSSKTTPPEPRCVFDRPVLLGKLGELSATVRKVWISSPGGAGKTTLVRTLVASDPRPLVWYHVDVEDADPANLFFYLSRTAPDGDGRNKPLPLLTPEYLPNLKVFCRTFFRAYFSRFAHGCVLVLDDFQEGPGEAFFGPVLQAAMAELPTNSMLFVLSREESYPSLARERVNRSLACLGWDDFRLSVDETQRFLSWSLKRDPAPGEIERAYALTHGWVAGLLLVIENPGAARPVPRGFSFERTDVLFDYFAGETFGRLREETQAFLLTCAFLPAVHADMARSLTGRVDAGDILRALMRGNHFTFRISVAPEVYRFHPLFRQFLIARAAREFSAERLREIRVQAARLLLAEGQIETGAELLVAARAAPDLIELVAAHAGTLLRQGRARTLLVWLKALPDDVRLANPWVRYWQGCCLNAENPAEAREELTRAFELFEAAGDVNGTMLAWAMVVYVIVVGWKDHTELDLWIRRFYELRERHPDFHSGENEPVVVQAICQALTWRQPSHPELPTWAARLKRLVMATSDRGFRILAGADLLLHHLFIGELPTALALVEALSADLHADEITPLQRLVWLGSQALTGAVSLDRIGCSSVVEAGRSIIAESGIHLLDMRVYGPVIALALNTGDLPLARSLLDELKDVPLVALVDQSLYCCMTADLSSLEGDATKALALADMAVGKAEADGAVFVRCLALSVSVVVFHGAGQRSRAKEALARGMEVSRGMNYFTCLFKLLAANFALEEGRIAEALPLLREALGVAARQGYLNFHPWRPAIMARLCREALNAGVETDYVRQLVSCRGLDSPEGEHPSLTPKESEILGWVVAGKTNGEIAVIQGVSERTVKFHVSNILQKLGANTRAHAVSLALERGHVPRG